MIKIIKNTMTEPIETTCPFCSSVLSYTYEDIIREEKQDYIMLLKTVNRYLVCPVCKHNINLDKLDPTVSLVAKGGKK